MSQLASQDARAREQRTLAADAGEGHTVRTVYGHEKVLRQTVIVLLGDAPVGDRRPGARKYGKGCLRSSLAEAL